MAADIRLIGRNAAMVDPASSLVSGALLRYSLGGRCGHIVFGHADRVSLLNWVVFQCKPRQTLPHRILSAGYGGK